MTDEWNDHGTKSDVYKAAESYIAAARHDRARTYLRTGIWFAVVAAGGFLALWAVSSFVTGSMAGPTSGTAAAVYLGIKLACALCLVLSLVQLAAAAVLSK